MTKDVSYSKTQNSQHVCRLPPGALLAQCTDLLYHLCGEESYGLKEAAPMPVYSAVLQGTCGTSYLADGCDKQKGI